MLGFLLRCYDTVRGLGPFFDLGDSRGTCPFASTLCVLGRDFIVNVGGGSRPGCFSWITCVSRKSSGLGWSFFDSLCSVLLVVHIGGCFAILTDLGGDGMVALAALLTWGWWLITR